MLQKMDPQQMQKLNLEGLKDFKKEVSNRKAELEAIKAKGGKAWTDELQEELDDIALFLVDIDDAIEEKASSTNASYIPASGTENMIHLSLVQGRRFNPHTGKEESKVFNQMFTFAEWQLFKKNHKNLGYTIMAALHDPYGDAAEFVYKD